MGKRFVELSTNANSGDGTGGIPPHVPETISCGRQVVTTAGTAVQLGSSTSVDGIIIVAEFDNTGVICVGDISVIADESTRIGVPLHPGDAVILNIDNISKIYIDSTIDSDGVTYTLVK